MSTDSKSPPPLDDEILKRLIELDIHERDASDLFGASGRVSKIPLEILLPEVLAATGQKFILWSLIFLTLFYKILPSSIVKFLNDKLVATLYENMPRKPTDLTGAIIDLPPDKMGRPNHPYARSVPLKESAALAEDLPCVEDVFDKLLKRSKTEDWDSLKKYAGGLSSLTFAFGTLVIHSVFNSERTQPAINNKTSSYFDLSPLYGDLPSEEKEVRNGELGRGLLHPDCFADARMLFLPPGAATLLVVFNRNHNYIAEQLLKKNERGHWHDPPPHDAAARAKQDEEIFQTARLINCQHFVNVVITDYVGGVMGMAARGGGWPGNAEALHEINLNGRKVSRGDGNLVSIEFNILYRWHSTLSKMDEEWFEDTLGHSLGDIKPNWNKLPVSEYERGNKNITPTLPVKDRTFAGLKRLPNGHFPDSDISKLLYRATEESAGFFRARGSPVVMKVIDEMGMTQARAWKSCTINELRKWLGLEPFKSFEDWNAYPEIANAARELYGDIDKLELYPGLHAEGHAEDGFEQKYNNLRVSTVRNGLLFDAIALIRGDPGLTTKFSPESVTPWGYADAARDPVTNKSFGGHMHKLLKRNLPHNFPDDNIYTWFPMSTPTFMKSNKNLPPQPNQPWNFERPV